MEEDDEGNFVEVDARKVEKAPQPDGFICPYVPSSDARIDVFIKEVAQIAKDDVVYDLGCGDGRLLIAVAKAFQCKCVGVDIDSSLIAQAQANAEAAGVDSLIHFQVEDCRETNLASATIVLMYLIPSALQLLKTSLREKWKTHSFQMHLFLHVFDSWRPDTWHKRGQIGTYASRSQEEARCTRCDGKVGKFGAKDGKEVEEERTMMMMKMMMMMMMMMMIAALVAQDALPLVLRYFPVIACSSWTFPEENDV